MNIPIIIGSTRQGRATPQVAAWVKKTADAVGGGVEFPLVDLKELGLPVFDEPEPPQDVQDRVPSPDVKVWLNILAPADGFIFVTPEYNHSIPSALKNAIDLVDYQFKRKPVAIVSFGGTAGGARANEHLRMILNSSLGALPIPESVVLKASPAFHPVFTDSHDLVEKHARAQRPLEGLVQSLVWHAAALKRAREE